MLKFGVLTCGRVGKAQTKTKTAAMKKKAAKPDSDIDIIEYVSCEGTLREPLMSNHSDVNTPSSTSPPTDDAK